MHVLPALLAHLQSRIDGCESERQAVLPILRALALHLESSATSYEALEADCERLITVMDANVNIGLPADFARPVGSRVLQPDQLDPSEPLTGTMLQRCLILVKSTIQRLELDAGSAAESEDADNDVPDA